METTFLLINTMQTQTIIMLILILLLSFFIYKLIKENIKIKLESKDNKELAIMLQYALTLEEKRKEHVINKIDVAINSYIIKKDTSQEDEHFINILKSIKNIPNNINFHPLKTNIQK